MNYEASFSQYVHENYVFNTPHKVSFYKRILHMPYCIIKYFQSLRKYFEISIKLWYLNHNNQESK